MRRRFHVSWSRIGDSWRLQVHAGLASWSSPPAADSTILDAAASHDQHDILGQSLVEFRSSRGMRTDIERLPTERVLPGTTRPWLDELHISGSLDPLRSTTSPHLRWVLSAPTIIEGARRVSPRYPSRLVVKALGRLVLDEQRFDLAQLSLAVLAGRLELAPEQVALVLTASTYELFGQERTPLTEEQLATASRALAGYSRSSTTSLLTATASGGRPYRALTTALDHLEDCACDLRTPPVSCPVRWADRVLDHHIEHHDDRRLGLPQAAGLDRHELRGGRSLRLLHSVGDVVRAGRVFDNCLQQQANDVLIGSRQYFVVQEGERGPIAVGHLTARDDRLQLETLLGHRNSEVDQSIWDDVRRAAASAPPPRLLP